VGASTSSLFSEIYLQYLEHTKILDHHQLIGYFRYVDDILIAYDTQLTHIYNVLDQFNKINSKLQLTLEEEEDRMIHFLDITIFRHNNNIQFLIFRKPTATDVIIPYDSYHPNEQKFSVIRYLKNRNVTYPITPEHKHKKMRPSITSYEPTSITPLSAANKKHPTI
jgi:hypothetical protein